MIVLGCADQENPTRGRKVIEGICLKGSAAIRMSAPIPHGAQRISCRVHYRRIEAVDIAMGFIQSMGDLVAQTEVQGQIRADLVIVLDEDLRRLQPRSVLGYDPCVPVLCQAQQEVCIIQAGCGVRRSTPAPFTVQFCVYWPEKFIVPAFASPQAV